MGIKKIGIGCLTTVLLSAACIVPVLAEEKEDSFEDNTFPSVVASDQFYSLEDLPSESDVLSRVLITDKEDTGDQKFSIAQAEDRDMRVTISGFDKDTLKKFKHAGSLTMTVQVQDSGGLTTKKNITIQLTSTKPKRSEVEKKIRTIRKGYEDTLMNESIWIENGSYKNLLEKTLENVNYHEQSIQEENASEEVSVNAKYKVAGSGQWKTAPIEKWSFDKDKTNEIHEYLDSTGFMNHGSENNLTNFYSKFLN